MLGEANEKKTNMDDLEGLKIDPRYLCNLLIFSKDCLGLNNIHSNALAFVT